MKKQEGYPRFDVMSLPLQGNSRGEQSLQPFEMDRWITPGF